MVFNFYINNKPDDDNKEEFESIMKKLEIHFADWNDKIRHFADIHRGTEPDTDFEKEVVNTMKDMISNNNKENKTDFNMYN